MCAYDRFLKYLTLGYLTFINLYEGLLFLYTQDSCLEQGQECHYNKLCININKSLLVYWKIFNNTQLLTQKTVD